MYSISDEEAPAAWSDLRARTEDLGFDMPSDARTGALLRALASSKPGGRLLELGTGTGLATAWLLSGMNRAASLVSVDNDARVQSVAREVLGNDPRVTFVLADGVEFLRSQELRTYDLVFADAWPGKYEARDVALDLVKPGGFYVGDDMLPQPNWPEGHQVRVDVLLLELRASPDWSLVAPAWGSGFVIAVRRA
jgi:predicted O-methyltransferase YrrM